MAAAQIWAWRVARMRRRQTQSHKYQDHKKRLFFHRCQCWRFNFELARGVALGVAINNTPIFDAILRWTYLEQVRIVTFK